MCNINEAWDFFCKTKNLKPTSLRKEQNRFNKHLKGYWENQLLQDIKVKDIIVYTQHLFNSNLSPQSVKLCLSLLRRIMNRAVQLELYKGVVPHFDMPIVDNSRLRFLSEEEASQLLIALHSKSELWHDISFFALHTGLRANEIFSIRLHSVDLSKRIIRVHETKNSQTRTVHISNETYQLIEKYYSKKQQYLFSDKKINEVSRVFHNTVKNIGLNTNDMDRRERIVFHSLRHTFASWLVQKSVPLVVVGSLLGHKELKMTQRYAHLAPEQEQYAITLLPSNISPFVCQA